MSNTNQELRKEAEQYLSQMQTKFRTDSRTWDRFAAEVPDKFIQLVKSGIKPSISRGSDSGYGGGRTLSVSLNFEANMDAAKQYIEDLKTEVPDRAKTFLKAMDSFDQKLDYFHKNGLDGELFEKLVKLFAQWVDYTKDLHVQIRDAKITVELPKKYLDKKKTWLELADTKKLEEDAKRYGIPVADVPKHRKYLEAKQKRVTAKTSAAMKAAIRLLRDLNGYQDSASLIEEAEKDVVRLQEKEAEAERIRKEEEERRKREEAERKEAERKKKLYQEAIKEMASGDEAVVAKAAKSLKSLGEYEDAPAKAKECAALIEKIKEEKEKKRLEEERKAEEKRRREEEERKRLEEEERKRKEAEEERKRMQKAKLKKTLTITGVVAGLMVLVYVATLIIPVILRASGKMLPEFSAEELTEAQAYVEAAVDNYEIYSKSNDFKTARVLLLDDLKTHYKGQVEINQWDVSAVKAAVIFYIGPKDETSAQNDKSKWEMKSDEPIVLEVGEKWFPVMTLLDGEKNVVYQFTSADVAEAVGGAGGSENMEALRMQLAQKELEKENYATQYAKQLNGFDAEVTAKLAENPDYLYTLQCWEACNGEGRSNGYCYNYAALCREAKVLEKRLNTLSGVGEENSWLVEQLLESDEELLEQKAQTLNSLYNLRRQIADLEKRAAKDLTELQAKLQVPEEQELDLLSEDLLHTALANSNSTTYYTYLRQEHIYVTALEAMDQGLAATDLSERRYVMSRNDIVLEGYSDYGNKLTGYMQNVLKLEQFETANAEALAAYEAENAAAKEAGGANYEQSIDYLKVQLKYESMINEHTALQTAVETSREEAEKVKAETEAEVAEKDELEQTRLTGIIIKEEKMALWEQMIKEEPLVTEYDAQKGQWGLVHGDYAAYQNEHLNYHVYTGGGGSGGGGSKCSLCNGTGSVRYNYGSSDLEAILSGHDPYTYGPCSRCGGDGKE